MNMAICGNHVIAVISWDCGKTRLNVLGIPRHDVIWSRGYGRDETSRDESRRDESISASRHLGGAARRDSARFAVAPRRRLGSRCEHAPPRRSVDGDGARLARGGLRSGPRAPRGALGRPALARRRSLDDDFADDGGRGVLRRTKPHAAPRRVDDGGAR